MSLGRRRAFRGRAEEPTVVAPVAAPVAVDSWSSTVTSTVSSTLTYTVEQEEDEAQVVAEPAAAEATVAEPTDAEAPEVAEIAEPDADQSVYWEIWREPIARVVRPVLGDLVASLPGDTTSAVVFTLDGLEICSANLDDQASAHVTAMAARMHALGSAALHQAAPASTEGAAADNVSLTIGDSRAVLVTIRELITSDLLLWVSSRDVNLGVITFQTKAAAERIGHLLTREDTVPDETSPQPISNH